MHAFARVRLSDGRRVELAPEAILGRMRSATVRFDEPSISEAHALVSLRGATLKLLALRGRLFVEGAEASDVTLRPGLRVELGPGVALEIEQVVLPDALIGVRAEDLPLQMLPPVASIDGVSGALIAGFLPEAEAWIWHDADGVKLRRGDEVERLTADEAFDAAGRTWVLERVRLGDAGVVATARPVVETPLTLTLLYDTVHIETDRPRRVEVVGIPGRIVCELAAIGQPVEWRVVAHEVWPHESDDALLRKNWDAGLARLRKVLAEEGVRGDLVRASGRGRIGLFLGPRDRVVDRQ